MERIVANCGWQRFSITFSYAISSKTGMTSCPLFDSLTIAPRPFFHPAIMKRFTVPCLFFGKQHSNFDIYVGDPNTAYDAIEFQAAWLIKCRSGAVDKQFRD